MTQGTTKELNTDGMGHYTAERSKLHKRIVTRLLKGVKGQKNPEIIFMGGGTAVGKSTVRKKYEKQYAPHGGIALIDCDDIKEFIPEYKELKRVDIQTAANLVHQESGDIAMVALEVALKERMHVIFDATMKDHVWYAGLIGEVKDRGYAAIAMIVYAPLQVAIEREAERALKTERVVPREEIILSHRLVRDSFVQLKELFDAYVLWDNSAPNFGEPVEIETFFPGMEESEVHDWTKYADFYAKKE